MIFNREKDITLLNAIPPSLTFVHPLEFRCYFCDEIKNEDPFYFELSSQKKEPVCRRCHEKMEVVRRLKEEPGKK